MTPNAEGLCDGTCEQLKKGYCTGNNGKICLRFKKRGGNQAKYRFHKKHNGRRV